MKLFFGALATICFFSIGDTSVLNHASPTQMVGPIAQNIITVREPGSTGLIETMSGSASDAIKSRLWSEFGKIAQFDIPNIAALRAWSVAPIIADASVQISGYYTPRDGGGGAFMWSPTSTVSDNGCTVIQASGAAKGRWLRVFDPGSINVRWCGAKGDGTTDDQSAIQAAIDIVSAMNGGEVQVPLGIYMLGRALILKNSVQLVGFGRNLGAGQDGSYKASILKPLVNMSSLIQQADYTQPLAKVALRNLYIDGRSYDGIVTNYLVDLTTHNSVFERNAIQNGSSGGLHIRANSLYVWINWIVDNTIGDFGDVGLNFEGSDTQIIGNYFSNCYSFNSIINSTGAVTFLGNRLELAGKTYSNKKC